VHVNRAGVLGACRSMLTCNADGSCWIGCHDGRLKRTTETRNWSRHGYEETEDLIVVEIADMIYKCTLGSSRCGESGVIT
jgi:hypothetical protein